MVSLEFAAECHNINYPLIVVMSPSSWLDNGLC